MVAFAKYADILGLVVEARSEISAHPELKPSLYLGTISNIENILLSANPMVGWDNVRSQLQGPTLHALEFCADALDRLTEEQEIAAEFLSEFRKEIEELTSRVLESEEEDALKQLLVSKLQELRQATIDYSLHDIAGIQQAVSSAVGAVVLAGAVATKEPRRKIVQDFLTILEKASALAERAAKHFPIAANSIKGLSGGGPPDAAA